MRRVSEEDGPALAAADFSFNIHSVIGEHALKHTYPILYAFKLGILAFDATRLCAADVDFRSIYKKGTFQMVEHRYERDDLRHISNWWQQKMRSSVEDLPSDWIESVIARSSRP